MGKMIIMLLLVSVSLFIMGCAQEEYVENELLAEASIASFDGSTITTEDGDRITLNNDYTGLFNDTEALRDANEGLETEDVVREYHDRIVIEKTTEVEIQSPEEYEEVFGNETSGPEGSSGASIERIIEGFKEECGRGRTSVLCEQDEEYIKELFSNKTGTHTIKERLNIRKIPLESFDFETSKTPEFLGDPLEVKVPKRFLQGSEGSEEMGFMPLQGMQYGGPSFQKATFIDGFTYGFELSYEKDYSWTFFGEPVARARLYSYIGYGLGLRIPFETRLEVYNSVIDSDPGDFRATARVEPKDLDAQGYADAGLSEMHLFDGKELVLKFGATTGATVKLLGETVFDSDFGKMIDNSKDFTPPLDGERENLGRLVFEGTDTGLYYGDEDFSVDGDIGISFNLKGEHIRFDCLGVNTACEDFEVTDEKTMDLQLENVIHYEEDQFGKYANFGLQLSNPRYKSSANFGAEFRVEASVKVPHIGWKSVSTPWFELYEFDVSMPYLERHPGTINRLSSDENKAYMNIPTADNITFMGEYALNVTSRCQKLDEIVPEGSEVEGVEDERVNLYTTFGDELGSMVIQDGVVQSMDCYVMHTDPTYEIELENYYLLDEMDGIGYEQGVDLIQQDRIKVKGVGTKNRIKSFIGTQIANVGLI
ncbi:hypothetical protein KY327_02895 [Candidatus Woesearchaeota archaeon]|nr:hypothetical protein [Candidatus Woesearchaeota archaeon]